MKRIIAVLTVLILIVSMAFGMTSCKGSGKDNKGFEFKEIELDLGGHVWDAGSKYFYLNNPLLTLSSGMLTNLSQLVVSRTSPNARLVVTNGSTLKVSGQVVVGNDASSSHGGIPMQT